MNAEVEAEGNEHRVEMNVKQFENCRPENKMTLQKCFIIHFNTHTKYI